MNLLCSCLTKTTRLPCKRKIQFFFSLLSKQHRELSEDAEEENTLPQPAGFLGSPPDLTLDVDFSSLRRKGKDALPHKIFLVGFMNPFLFLVILVKSVFTWNSQNQPSEASVRGDVALT